MAEEDDEDEEETLEEEIERLRENYREAKARGDEETAAAWARRLRSLNADPEG